MLPTDEPSLLKHYTLAEHDLADIRHRRRPHNRLGFALQLCALRYPGRLLSLGEVIPHEVVRFLAMQLVLQADDLLAYASREETRHEHLAILRKTVGTVAVMKGRPVSGVCGEKTLNKRNRGSFCPPRREPRFGFLQDFEDRAPIRIGQVRKRGAPVRTPEHLPQSPVDGVAGDLGQTLESVGIDEVAQGVTKEPPAEVQLRAFSLSVCR